MSSKPKVISAVVVVFGLIAFVATRANGDAGPSLRTARVTDRSVSKTVSEVGTIEPVSAASVAFPVAGTVATIAVTKGQSVTRGQTLATLDTIELQRALNAAKAALSEAKLKLAEAIAGNANASSNGGARSQDQLVDALAEVRQAVLDAQQLVDQRIGDAQAQYEAAQNVCAAVTADDVATCQAALTDVLSAQQATADAQQTLRAASSAFDQAVEAKAESVSSQNNQPSQSDQPATSSAADLAAMQKDIDAASAGVAVAEQNLSAATIVSPIDGTIESLGLQVGDAVTAASTDAVIDVVGPNGYEVTTIVAVEKLANIKLGQKATVTPDGSNTSRDGEVVAIGAPRTANGATSYPVSIGLDDDASLRNGSVASVSITTGSASTGLAVPTSAVRTESGQSTVTVVTNGKLEVKSVTVGVVGSVWTQIKTGLTEGQQVVIADLSEPLPDSATNATNGNNNERNGPTSGFIQGPITIQGGPKGG